MDENKKPEDSDLEVVSMKDREPALETLAKINGVSVEYMRKFFQRISKETIEEMDRRDQLKVALTEHCKEGDPCPTGDGGVLLLAIH